MDKEDISPADAIALPTADAAEEAFYTALQTGNLDQLMACWIDGGGDGEDKGDACVCVHPGGGRMLGKAAIRGSFAAIFQHGPIPVQPLEVTRMEAPGASVHSVLERIEVQTDEGPRQAIILATNCYLLTLAGWRLVAHHASPGGLLMQQEGMPQQPYTLH